MSDRLDSLDRRRFSKIAAAGVATAPRVTTIDGQDRFRGPLPKQEG